MISVVYNVYYLLCFHVIYFIFKRNEVVDYLLRSLCFIALIGLCVRLSRDIVYKDLNTIHRIFLRIGFKTVSETTHWNALNKCNLNSQFSRPCFLCQWFYLVRTPVLEPSLGFLWCSEKTFAKTHIYIATSTFIFTLTTVKEIWTYFP